MSADCRGAISGLMRRLYWTFELPCGGISNLIISKCLQGSNTAQHATLAYSQSQMPHCIVQENGSPASPAQLALKFMVLDGTCSSEILSTAAHKSMMCTYMCKSGVILSVRWQMKPCICSW